MKYIIERTSCCYARFAETEEEIQETNPCPQLNPKLEDVIYCHKIDQTIEELNIKYPYLNFSEYKNGLGGCYKEIKEKAWTLEIEDILDFIKKVGCKVIIDFTDDNYEFPKIEIRNGYRE